MLTLAPPDSKLASIHARIDREPHAGEARFWQLFTVPEAAKLFTAPFWRSKRSDLYGGPAWATITERFGKLLDAFKRKDMNALAMEVDHTYDLDHNTGSIGSKYPPGKRVSGWSLDRRAEIGTLKDFSKRVSPSVAALINQSVRLGESQELCMQQIRKMPRLMEGVPEEITLAAILNIVD